MQEVIHKIKELYSLLESKMKDADARYADAEKKLELVNEAQRKLEATQNHNAALERKLKSADEFEAVKKRVEAIQKKNDEDFNRNQKSAADILSLQNDLNSKQAELDNLIEVYKKKHTDIEKQKADLLEEKKNLRTKILEEIKNKL